MGQWVELELRIEQLNFIIDCLELKACNSDYFDEIENCVYLIENLRNQEEEYNRKVYENGVIEL